MTPALESQPDLSRILIQNVRRVEHDTPRRSAEVLPWYPRILLANASASLVLRPRSRAKLGNQPRYSPLATDLTAREVSSQRTEAARDFH